MLVVTWNIAGARGLAEDALASVVTQLATLEPDLVALQEVHKGLAEPLRIKLGDIGLQGFHYSRHDEAVCKHGEVIAARGKLVASDRAWCTKAPYSELFAHAHVELPEVEVDAVTVHVPNDSSNGWDKVRHLEALLAYLADAPRDTPRIVTGDFNEPWEVRANGEWVASRHRELRDGTLSAEGDLELMGETFPRARWIDAVLGIFEGEDRHGLRHAYFARHPYQPNPVTYRTPNPRFFDHILVSEHFEVVEARYETDWIDRGWSDHAPGVVELKRRIR